MDKSNLLEGLQAFYAQLLAEPKTPFTASIKQELESCHRRLAQKEQSDLAMAGEVNELLHEMSSLEHRYQTKLSEPAQAILKPVRDQVFQILTREQNVLGVIF